jgi:hypothetical protein
VRAFRRFSFPVGLAVTLLSRRLGRVLLAAAGIAAGAATLAVVLGAGSIAQDRSLGRALRALPAEQRAVRASWFGTAVDPSGFRELDGGVRKAFRGIGSETPIRAVLFRQTNIAGHGFNLGAAEQLGRWIRLRSGRAPRECTPARCEVVQVAGSGPIPEAEGLHLRRVGYADLVSRVPFQQTSSYGRPVEDIYSFVPPSQRPPFLLTGDVRGATRLPLLRPIFRSYAWVFRLAPRDVHPWAIDGLSRRIERARSALTANTFYFDVGDPLAELTPVVSANRVTARRLLLVGGQAAALLLAFVVLVAASGRTDAALTRGRLARFGARRRQIVSFALAEAAVVCVAAALLGWAAGAAIAAAIADRAGAPAGAVLAHSTFSGTGIVLALGLAAAAAAVLLLALHAPVVQVARLSVSALDVAALAAVGAIALALARGSADADELAREGGTGVLLFLLPALIAFVAAVAAVRLLGPVARTLDRLARRLSVSGRLAALSLARDAGYAGAAAAFLLVSVGLAAFSLDYRSTLVRSQSDQARFATPPDAVLRATSSQRRSLRDPRLATAYSESARSATPVLRLDGQIGSGASSRAVSVLGVPAAAIRKPAFWRSDFSSESPAALAASVELGGSGLRGVRLPRDASELRLRVRERGAPLRVVASVAARNGSFAFFELSHDPPVLKGHIPRAGRGGRLVGLGFSQTEPDTHNGRPASGTLVLGPLSARGPGGTHVLETSFADWIGTGGIRASGRRVGYFVTNASDSRLRVRQRTDEVRLPVIVTPRIAGTVGRGGLVPIRIGDTTLVARAAAVARRFPSVYGDFAVADRDALATALNSLAPGSAITNEVWLDGISDRGERMLASAVGRPPLQDVRATFRDRVEASLQNDPLARAVLWTLAGLAIVGFALALAGLGVTLAADLRDERGELFDLEAQGARPSSLRRHVRLRSSGVLALGILGGAAVGAVLSVLVVDVVLVTANGRLPEPPLLLTVDWRLVFAGLAAYLLCAAGLVSVATRGAFR